MFPASPIPLILASEAVLTGQNRNSIPVRARGPRADLVKIRPGVYADKTAWSKLRPDKKHLVRVCAAQAGSPSPGPKSILAYESAAVVYGIPMIGSLPERVRYVDAITGRGVRRSAVSHISTSSREFGIARVGNVRLTSPAQTLVDLARKRSLVSSLASVDHALAKQMVTKEELFRCLKVQSGLRGNVRARRAIELADARSESVGESLSRAMMITHHLPMPKLQEEIFTKEGILAGRVDFLWPEYGVVGEFDGVGKYQGDGAGGLRTAIDERHRENLIEVASGMRVVRWTWDDAYRDDAHGMLMLLRAVGIQSLVN